MLHAMKERPNRELAFERPERGFRFRQLDVLRPEFLGGLPGEIRAQEIGAPRVHPATSVGPR
jgi:hypothetical protein